MALVIPPARGAEYLDVLAAGVAAGVSGPQQRGRGRSGGRAGSTAGRSPRPAVLPE